MNSLAQPTASPRQHSNAYNIFILVLTVLSIAVMVVMPLPISDSTLKLLSFYDTLICVIFIIDFSLNLRVAPNKSDYFIRQRGWLDLRGENKKTLVKDILDHRSQYTGFITILLTILVLTVASVLVLQFESQSPEAKTITGSDAFWYSIVTITTVGYGDYYPVTAGGRITAMFIMFAGVGIIGVLASLLSSLLVGSPSAPAEEKAPGGALAPAAEIDIAEIKNELAAMRQLLERVTSKEDDR